MGLCPGEESFVLVGTVVCAVISRVATVAVALTAQVVREAPGLARGSGGQGNVVACAAFADVARAHTGAIRHLLETIMHAVGSSDDLIAARVTTCLLYTSPSPRDRQKYRMPSSA